MKVKKIANILVLVLFVLRLVSLDWSGGATAVINQAATLIISIAAGMALLSLILTKFGGNRDGES